MAETLKYLSDLLVEAGDVDVTASYERMWKIAQELRVKVDARFTTTRDPSTDHLQDYGDPATGPAGNLSGFVGPEIDWMVHSWIGDLTRSFANVHLTVWLGPQIKVPHLGIAFGTIPKPWFYLDYPYRADLAVDLDYFDRYFAPVNEHFLERKADPRLTWFTSRDPYIRHVVSDVGLCYSCDDTPEMWDLISAEAHLLTDRWLQWVDEADPVPLEQRAALAERDRILRNTIIERDPANIIAVERFGAELTAKLLRGLAGTDRVLPRPGLD